MKRTIKTYFKFFIFLFGISLLLVNCEKDIIEDATKQEEKELTTKIRHARFISGNEIEKISEVSKALEKYNEKSTQNNSQNKEIYSDVYGFTIETDDALLSIDTIYKTYTFKISRENPEDNLLENLLIVIDTVTSETTQLLVKYPLLTDDSYDYENATVEEIFDENLTYEKFSAECYTVVQEPLVTIDYPCYSGMHNGDDDPCIDGVQRAFTLEYGGSTIQYCPDTGGTTNTNGSTTYYGGGNGSYTYYNPNTPGAGIIPMDDLLVPVSLQVSSCLTTGYPDGTFGDFTEEMYNWVNNAVSGTSEGRAVLALNTYLQANNCSPEAQSFGVLATEAIMNGGEFDYINKVVLDPTVINNQKVKCVYDKLKGLSNTIFSDIINDHFGSSNTSNLKFEIGNIPSQLGNTDAFTYTSYEMGNALRPGDVMTVRLGSDFVQNASAIEIALALIHESIHAELLNRAIELGLLQEVTVLGHTTFTGTLNSFTLQDVIF